MLKKKTKKEEHERGEQRAPSFERHYRSVCRLLQ